MDFKTPNRPQVTKITVEITNPDGSKRIKEIDPTKTEALFWSDRAVKDILIPFYKTKKAPVPGGEVKLDMNLRTTATETESAESPEALPDLTESTPIPVFSPDDVDNMWTSQKEDGFLPPLITKTTKCTPEDG